MTVQQVRQEMINLDLYKYNKYMTSFWSLTKDEREGVTNKNHRLAKFLELLQAEMKILSKMLSEALMTDNTDALLNEALQIESLEDTLKLTTFKRIK